MALPAPTRAPLPAWLRWCALLWLAIWIPAYWYTWGAANFLHLCDVAVVLTCISLWTNNSLLLSSQAVSSLLIDTVWASDAAWRLLTGHHLIGGTEYLFDATFPRWVRLLSLFHVAMPVLLLWALHRLGYDRRGWITQCLIAIPAVLLSRLASTPQTNINYVFTDPFFHRAWGPAPFHLAAVLLFLMFVVYLPTHLFLVRLFPRPRDPATFP
ncbi:MAG TPA: hypothetical protein VN861_16775 [Candidatus Acidoferrales bacterium]|nr:hypothetical protein [Candidatus Acidoferrales bacterium]